MSLQEFNNKIGIHEEILNEKDILISRLERELSEFQRGLQEERSQLIEKEHELADLSGDDGPIVQKDGAFPIIFFFISKNY